MPAIWLDVDTALSGVPINSVPLIDDTDFKTREESVVYNQAGLDLVWNFVTSAGAFTQTAVTPTEAAGLHDWVNQGNAMYTIEIPASGGTINNDTEGYGWFTGYATGILPWSGPIIGFRAAGLNDLLIDSAFSTTRGLAGTALPAAAADGVGGLPISEAGGLDMDAMAADVAGLNGEPMRGTNSAALASVCTEARLAELDAANLPTDISAVKADTGAVKSKTDNLPADPADDSDIDTQLAAIAGYLDTEIASIIAALATIAGDVAGLDGEAMRGTNSAALASVCTEARLSNLDATISSRSTVTPAQVNTEVLDVLNTDTFAESGQEAPGATISLAKKIGYIYKFMRNKITNDGTQIKVYADDITTVDQKSNVSEAGGTVTRGEFGSGP